MWKPFLGWGVAVCALRPRDSRDVHQPKHNLCDRLCASLLTSCAAAVSCRSVWYVIEYGMIWYHPSLSLFASRPLHLSLFCAPASVVRAKLATDSGHTAFFYTTKSVCAKHRSKMMFITPKRRSPRAHAQNTRISTTDTRRLYARTHICAPGTSPVQPSKGSISGEKGWGAVCASG
jgi:hypothetical protein